jgi:hypothetical protein
LPVLSCVDRGSRPPPPTSSSSGPLPVLSDLDGLLDWA